MDVLSLWRSPLDQVALSEAHRLSARQPLCTSVPFNQAFNLMTIYNYGSYVGSPGGTAAHNSTELGNMFSDMATASPIGGTAFIPQDEFQVNAVGSGFAVPDQCNIIGSGGGGKSIGGTDFYHFVINMSGGATFLNCR